MISAERLREVMRYEPDTGSFIRLSKTGRKGQIGSSVGTRNLSGYVVIGIDGGVYYAHRLAWLYMTGDVVHQIDHKDGDRANNRFGNLRPATHQQNVLNAKRAANNTSGFKGVSWHKRSGKWDAHINLNGKKHHLGLFETAEDAHAAYMRAAKNAQPEFARAS